MRLSSAALFAAGAGGLAFLSACATTPMRAPAPSRPETTPTPTAAPAPVAPSPSPPSRALVSLSTLPGWSEEDHSAALQAFQVGCGAAKASVWRTVCARAKEQTATDEASARAFFEDNFKADARPATGLLTAYFAPAYPAQATPDEIFSAPVRPKPDDLVMTDPGPGDPPGHKAARQVIDSDLVPYPDRTDIEAEPVDKALAFMKPEDLFFLQIQGSGELVFPDGRRMKAIYAADNGRPFVGIARPMGEAGLLAANHTSGDAIRTWLADHRGADANAVMDKNPRYVFFNVVADDDHDPAGAAGVALPAGRSIAVDPSYHAYGELYWIDAAAPVLTGGAKTYRRLAVALDTGSAIRGDVRADLYMGRGDQAGAEAGHVRHTLVLVRLVPVQGRGPGAGQTPGQTQIQTTGGKDEKTPQG
jgi:membrane-bound lytic murein transglycosylase A